MTYAIIGAGKIGTALARVFSQHNIPLKIANSRSPETLSALASELGPGVQAVTVQEAYTAEIIFLAIPFAKYGELAQQFPQWNGKIVVDMMNAFGIPVEDLGGLFSSEAVSKAFVGSRLVKAFNHLPAGKLGMQAPSAGQRQVIFVAGDDAQANATVAELATHLGFAPVELGSLHHVGALLHVQDKVRGGLLLQNLFKLA